MAGRYEMDIEKPILIKQNSLMRALGFSRSTFYRRLNDKAFPQPIKINSGRQGHVYYRVADVEAYIESLAGGGNG